MFRMVKKIGNERAYKSSPVRLGEFMSSKGNKQYSDMGDRAVVSNTGKTADAWFLDGYSQQTTEDSFDSCATIVVLFKLLGSIRDLISEGFGNAPQIVTAFLPGELRMCCRTEEQVLRLWSEKERALVLDVGYAFYGHTPVAVHGDVSRADNLLAFSHEAVFVLGVSWIVRDEGAGLEGIDDVLEDRLGVVFGVAGDRFKLKAKGLGGRIQQGDGQCGF